MDKRPGLTADQDGSVLVAGLVILGTCGGIAAADWWCQAKPKLK